MSQALKKEEAASRQTGAASSSAYLSPSTKKKGSVILLQPNDPSKMGGSQLAEIHYIIPMLHVGKIFLDIIRTLPGIKPTEKALLRELYFYAGENGRCYPKQKKMALDLGVSRNTVGNNLDKLRKKGFINWVPRDGGQNDYYFAWRHEYFQGVPKKQTGDAQKVGKGCTKSGQGVHKKWASTNSTGNGEIKKTPQEERQGGVVFSSGESEEVLAAISLLAPRKNNPGGWACWARREFSRGASGDLDIPSLLNEATEVRTAEIEQQAQTQALVADEEEQRRSKEEQRRRWEVAHADRKAKIQSLIDNLGAEAVVTQMRQYNWCSFRVGWEGMYYEIARIVLMELCPAEAAGIPNDYRKLSE
jgi:hypothetical protein